MFNLDKEKIECALGNQEFCLWQGKQTENVVFISDVGIHGIHLSLTLGTAKFKQLDESCSFKKGGK